MRSEEHSAGRSEDGVERSHADGRDNAPPDIATNRDLGVRNPTSNRAFLMPALVVLGVAGWCISVMAIGVNLAESAWEWAWILAFGTAMPAAFLWQANRLLAPREQVFSAPSTKTFDA